MNIIDATYARANQILDRIERRVPHEDAELAHKIGLLTYLLSQELREKGHHGLAESWEQLGRYTSNIIMLDAERRV